MPKLATGANSRRPGVVLSEAAARGFTLVELLVVVIIAGILTGAVLLGLGRSGPDQVHKRELARLSVSLEAMCDQALLGGAARGLRFHAEGYDFWRFEDGRWQSLAPDSRPHAVRWPNQIRPRVQVEGIALRSAGNARLPQIVCTGIEPATAFFIEIGRSEHRQSMSWPN